MEEYNKKNEKEDIRIYRTKRDLANSLVELLQEKNFDDLSINEICEKAYISKNTFYNNFDDKNQLLEFVFEKYRDELMKKVKPLFESYKPLKKPIFLKKIVENIVHYFYESYLPIQKMIINDASHVIFWNLQIFIQKVLLDLEKEYPNLVSNRINDKITAIFYSGAFTSMIYFGTKDKDYNPTEKDLVKAIIRLTNPVIN